MKNLPNSIAIAALLGQAVGQNLFLSEMKEVTDDPLAWKNTKLSPDERATLLVNAMNFTEKATLLSRYQKNTPAKDWTGATSAIERLQVPEIRYQDGP